MVTWIVSDNAANATTLRNALTRVGYDVPPDHVVSLSGSVSTIPADSARRTAIVVQLLPQPGRAVSVIRELRGRINGPIVAVGPKDPAVILETVHAGIDDYLEDSNDIELELTGTLRRLVAGRAAGPAGKLIVVLSGCGGSGQSHIAVNVATSLARSQGSSCLIDLDAAGGGSALMLNLKPRHTVMDLARHAEKVDRNAIEKTLITHDSGVHLLAAPQELVPPEAISDDFSERVIREARGMFPAVVVDFVEIARGGLLKKLSAQSAQFVLVTRMDFQSVRNSALVLNHLERLGIARQSVVVVSNRVGQPGEVSKRKVEQALAVRIAHSVPEDALTLAVSVNTGSPYVIEAPLSPLGKSVQALAEGLRTGQVGAAPTAAAQTAKRSSEATASESSSSDSWTWNGLVSRLPKLVRT